MYLYFKSCIFDHMYQLETDYRVVVDRVYPNPKTRRVFFAIFTNPKLPEPELFAISWTWNYPNPKFSGFHKPEATRNPKFSGFPKPVPTRTRNFWVFINLKLPEPETQTRGYLTGLETLKIVPKVLQILPKTLTISKSIRKWLYFIAKDTILASF